MAMVANLNSRINRRCTGQAETRSFRQILQECRHPEPAKRPALGEIADQLRMLLDGLEDGVDDLPMPPTSCGCTIS